MKKYLLAPALLTILAAGSLSADWGNANNRYSAATTQTGSVTSYPKDQAKTESDRAVNQRIRQQVTELHPEMFKEIILRTSEGMVVIDGFVYTPNDQKLLTDQIEEINGVKHLVNNTKIKKQ